MREHVGGLNTNPNNYEGPTGIDGANGVQEGSIPIAPEYNPNIPIAPEYNPNQQQEASSQEGYQQPSSASGTMDQLAAARAAIEARRQAESEQQSREKDKEINKKELEQQQEEREKSNTRLKNSSIKNSSSKQSNESYRNINTRFKKNNASTKQIDEDLSQYTKRSPEVSRIDDNDITNIGRNVAYRTNEPGTFVKNQSEKDRSNDITERVLRELKPEYRSKSDKLNRQSAKSQIVDAVSKMQEEGDFESGAFYGDKSPTGAIPLPTGGPIVKRGESLTEMFPLETMEHWQTPEGIAFPDQYRPNIIHEPTQWGRNEDDPADQTIYRGEDRYWIRDPKTGNYINEKGQINDLGPAPYRPIYVDEAGQSYYDRYPVNAIVKANLDDTRFLAKNEDNNKLEDNNPRNEEGPTHPWMSSRWGTPKRPLLEGQLGDYNYVAQQEQNDKRSQEEIIQDSIKKQAEMVDLESRYPHAVDVSLQCPTFEQYEKDYEEGRREIGRYNDGLIGKAVERIRNSVQNILNWYHEAYIPLDSEHIDEHGNIRYGERTEAAIVNFMNHMGFAPQERYMVMQMAIKALGLAPDRNGLFFKKSKREKIPDQIFIEALNNIMLSCQSDMYGHPYGMVNMAMKLGGTRCFPIGVMTKHEAEILCKPGHIFDGQDPIDLMSKTGETWINETWPNIRKNVYRQENGEAQMLAIEDLVRAVCSLDGINPRKYGVSNDVDRGYNEMMAETVEGYKLNETEEDRQVNEIRSRQLRTARMRYERSSTRLDRKRNRMYEIYDEDVVDDNGVVLHQKGEITEEYVKLPGGKIIRAPWRNTEHNFANRKYIRNPKANAFESVCMSVANMAKFAGVVGYVPIMASGVVEHAQGNINTKVSNGLLFWGNEQFKPNDAMYAHITSEGGIEAIAALKALVHAGGQDALIMFYKEGYTVLNKDNALKFINEFIKREGSDSVVAGKAREFMARAEEAVHWLMPGDIGFGAADAKRWLEGFMINNMFNATDPLKMEPSFNSDQVLEMMDSMGIERFLASTTEMNASRDALIMMRNQTFDRISPLTHIVDNLLRSNGITNMVVTLGIDTYFTYGLNLIQMMIPFSNTASYLSLKGINYLITGGRNNPDQLDIDLLNYQMGGNDEFGVGLRKNFIYDCIKLGNIALISGFAYFVIAALGFDEPVDPLNKYVWSEYRIGRNINLGGNDENGNPTGIPVYAAWWLNDLTMFGLPAAYALHASQLDQKLGDNDPDLSWKLFKSGCYDMLSGCSLLDLIKSFSNAQRDFEYYERMMQDPNMKCPPDWFSFGALQAELWCARGINKFVPNALKSLKTDTLIVGENALDHTAYEVYDRNSDIPGKTEYVEDWFELQRRIESKYNPVYALFNNLTKNGYFFDNGTTEKTGYLFDEMPIATAKDPARMTWAHKYNYDPNNIPGGEANRIPYTEECIEKVLNDIDSFNSVEEALSQGYMIPASLRYKMRDYCYQRINFEENLYNQRIHDGYYTGDPVAKQQGYTDMTNNKNKWYNYLNNWVFNKDIPWTDTGYAKLITSSQDVYFYKDSGKPATMFDYWQYGPETVEQRFLPRGDHPTSFLPFTSPDNRGRGYNYETIANWYKEGESGTDTQKVFNLFNQPQYDEDGNLISEHATVPYGRDAGVYTNTAIFGGDPNFKTNDLIESNEYRAINKPTMGYRAYVPWEDSFLFDLPNANVFRNKDGEIVKGNDSGVTNTDAFFKDLKSKGREDVDGNSSMGDMGLYRDKDSWKTSSYPNYGRRSWISGSSRGVYRGRSSYSKSEYNPKIYSTKVYNSKTYNSKVNISSRIGNSRISNSRINNSHANNTKLSNTRIGSTRTSPEARQVNNDRASSIGVRTPQDARTTNLNPNFETKGSREAYKRQDI